MHTNSEGVPQDDAEAVKWYRRAADQGDAKAQDNLGAMYATGRGVPRDDAEAVKWFRRAAIQGDADAENNLGRMYAKGRGVPAALDLIIAANYDDAATVQALLAEGVDVNTRNKLGQTALMMASRDGHLDVVQALLAKGADVNAMDNGGETTPLMEGSRVVGYAKNIGNRTALMMASWNGHPDVVRALLAKGADVNAKMSIGWTALTMAKEAEVRALLIQAGAKP